MASAAWIVAVGATGLWAGQDGRIAVLDDAGWSFVVPQDGCIAFVRDEQCLICSIGGTWHDSWPVRSLTVAGQPMLGATIGTVTQATGGAIIDLAARTTLVQLTTALARLGLITVN